MAGVTGIAGPFGPIGIKPPDARVGPAFPRELVGRGLIDNHLAAVATLATQDGHRLAAGDMGQVSIGRFKDLPGMGMIGGLHLLGLAGMALAAILRCYQRGNVRPFVQESIGLPALGAVAPDACHLVDGVLGFEPLLVKSR